jgi:hypothetical protein
MLTDSKTLKGFSVHAKDGELGVVEDLCFDDEAWGVRYFVVETGGWMGGRPVLISPISVTETDWEAKRLHVSLTKEQVMNSPPIDTHKPVSRQHEATYMSYYGYPYYWGGPMMWGPGYLPAALAIPTAAGARPAEKESPDSHLRSASAVEGYSIVAKDGEIGHVKGFLVDDSAWAIRYMEVATKNWWPGRKVLVSPAWIDQVSWVRSTVSVDLTREAIRSAPEYTEGLPVTREYEELLHRHYGLAPWWLHEKTAAKSALGSIGAM